MSSFDLLHVSFMLLHIDYVIYGLLPE